MGYEQRAISWSSLGMERVGVLTDKYVKFMAEKAEKIAEGGYGTLNYKLSVYYKATTNSRMTHKYP
jgi:hypothetical protein